MAEVLELPHLVEHHRVAEVQVGRGRVEADLDRAAAGRSRAACFQLVALEDFVGATADQVQGCLGRDAKTVKISLTGSRVS